jgi:hypothetical protein
MDKLGRHLEEWTWYIRCHMRDNDGHSLPEGIKVPAHIEGPIAQTSWTCC